MSGGEIPTGPDAMKRKLKRSTKLITLKSFFLLRQLRQRSKLITRPPSSTPNPSEVKAHLSSPMSGGEIPMGRNTKKRKRKRSTPSSPNPSEGAGGEIPTGPDAKKRKRKRSTPSSDDKSCKGEETPKRCDGDSSDADSFDAKRILERESSVGETMSSLSSKFSAAKTGVFWDLDGCPIPPGLSPVSIRANIKLALENMGYTGNVSIVAFALDKQSKQVQSEFKSAQIELKHRGTREDKYRFMYLDMMFWGVKHKHEPANVMLITKDLLRDLVALRPELALLKEKETNILLVHRINPAGGLPLRDIATSTWLWKSLATGGSPLVGHCIRPEPAMPPCSVCKFSAAETGVFWDLDGCPILPRLNPAMISANIKLALENMGYTGNVSISAYFAEKQSEQVESEFKAAKIELKHRGTFKEKDRLMYLDIMFWGIKHRGEPTNVVVIADDLLPKVNFVLGLDTLKENENNVLLAQPRNNPEGLQLPDTTSIWLWKSLASGGSPLDGGTRTNSTLFCLQHKGTSSSQ